MDLLGGYGSDSSEEHVDVALPAVNTAPDVSSFAHMDGSQQHIVSSSATTISVNPTVAEMYAAVDVSTYLPAEFAWAVGSLLFAGTQREASNPDSAREAKAWL